VSRGVQPVVGAAILRDGRVLAARRTSPATAAGRWEFPGGKVEPGETPAQALVREIAEELGCRLQVTGWLEGEVAIGATHVLTVALATVEGEPMPHEHDALVWLGLDELDRVDWLDPDRPFLPELRQRMMGQMRGIFFDESDAAAAAGQLRADGYQASIAREQYAGEDDDEDHPWSVTTDAPLFQLELLVDQYDGWLDADHPKRPPVPPLHLPSAPRRIKKSVDGDQ